MVGKNRNKVMNMTKKRYDIVMLYSGGADSRLMLEFARRMNKKVFAVVVDYGQRHQKELAYAVTTLKKLGIDYQMVEINGLKVHSKLIDGEVIYDGVNEHHVPARNTWLIGIALAYAESLGADEVWYGADFSDRLNLFPDCYQEYVVKYNELAELGLSRPIKIKAPLLGLEKEDVIELLKSFGVEENEYFSGYGGIENERGIKQDNDKVEVEWGWT